MPNQFLKYFPLVKSRAHEVTGAAAVSFSAIVCGLGDKSALWVAEGWQRKTLNPVGLAKFLAPQRLILAHTKNTIDTLAISEEALRSGAVSVVVAELNTPLGLTAGRRLQLAAKAGQCTGLFIVPEGMGSNAAETRWRCSPLFDPADSTLQRWELIKNKSGTLAAWKVRWDEQTRRIIMVSKAGQRPGSANTPN